MGHNHLNKCKISCFGGLLNEKQMSTFVHFLYFLNPIDFLNQCFIKYWLKKTCFLLQAPHQQKRSCLFYLINFEEYSICIFLTSFCWYWLGFPYMESGQLHPIHPHPRMTEWGWNEKNGSFLGHSTGMMPEWKGFHPSHSSIISSFGGHSDFEWPPNDKRESFSCHSCNLT